MNGHALTRWGVLALVVTATAAGQSSQPGAGASLPEITTVEGETFSGRLESIDADQAVFKTPQATRTLPLRQLWLIQFAKSGRLQDRIGQKVIVLAGEGALGVADLSVGEGKISLDSGLLGRALLDLSAAGVIYLPHREQPTKVLRDHHRDLKLPRSANDYLIAKDAKGNLVPFPGVLRTITSGRVTFELNKKDRTIDLAAVRVIELAPVPRETKAPGGLLVGKDGSTVPFGSLRFSGSKLSVVGDGLKADAADIAAVAEIRFHSDRLVYLSELEPARVVQAGLFDVAFSYQRDRSTAGGPIRLGQVTYRRGLSLHSRCELTYDLAGRFTMFAATAGIDAAAGTRGNAELRILGDGKELQKPLKLLGGAEPVPVQCDVAGVKQLTLLADYGEDGLDVGDYVDLAEARLIRP